MCENYSGNHQEMEMAKLLKKCEILREQVIQHFNSRIEDYDPNKFNNMNSLAPIIGTICDQQIKVEVAWAIPFHLNRWLKENGKEFKASEIRKIGKEKIREWLDKHMSNQWPSRMSSQDREKWLDNISNYIILTCKKIEEEYKDEPDNIFMINNGRLLIPLVYFLLRQFSGIGPKKASMIARDFGKEGGWLRSVAERLRRKGVKITIEQTHYTEVPIDIHVKRVFKKIGFGKYQEPQDFQNLARLIYPDNPGLVDDFIWNLGREICKTKPECEKCPIQSICDYYNKATT